MKPIDGLRQAKAKISDPRNWIKGAWAEDMNGMPVSSNHPTACKFCAVGALHRVFDENANENGDGAWYAMAIKALRKAVRLVCSSEVMRVPSFNDFPLTTHEDVMALYDRAIDSLKEESNADNTGDPEVRPDFIV